MKYPMAKTRLATCRHEAAHTVIAERFGLRIKKAHVPLKRGKHKGGSGYVEYGDARRIGPVQMSVVMMAGSVAEHLWHGTPKGLVSHWDAEDLKKMGMKGEDFRIIWEEAQRMVRANKSKIWRLAKVLSKGKVVYR